MPSTPAVPALHAHPRRAGLLDWLTAVIWLVITIGFLASLPAPAPGQAGGGPAGCYAGCSPPSTSSSAPRKAST